MLVLSPTRELALQIENEVNKYSYRGIKCCCVYGGGNRREQVTTVRQGVEIVVATPGRLNDLIASDVLSLNSVSYLVRLLLPAWNFPADACFSFPGAGRS